MGKENKYIIKAFLILFIAIICSGLISIWLVFYGPLTPVKELYVTTAMTTFKHQYLARIFVSDEEIERIMEKNSIGEITEETDVARIMIPSDKEAFELERLEGIGRKGNDLRNQNGIFEKSDLKQSEIEYKVINGKTYKGWLIIVKDPSRVVIGSTGNLGKRGMKLDQIIEKYDAVAGINAGGFSDDGGHGTGGVPTGLLIEDYEVLYKNDNYKYGIIGFDRFNRLILGNYSIAEMKDKEVRDAISFGPFLIVNGNPSIKKGNGGRGLQPRTAIGQRADGTVLLLAIDGRQVSSVGATLRDVQDIMLEYGAVNAANLDGGSSTTIYYEGIIPADRREQGICHRRL